MTTSRSTMGKFWSGSGLADLCCAMAASGMLVLSLRWRMVSLSLRPLWCVHLSSLSPCYSRVPIRSFSNYHRILQTISFGAITRIRPLHLLVATGSGYVGYWQYDKYKQQELERHGLEGLRQPSIAAAWQVQPSKVNQFTIFQVEVHLYILSTTALCIMYNTSGFIGENHETVYTLAICD